MSTSAAVVSETLQAITRTKIAELQKQRVAFQRSKDSLFAAADKSENSVQRLRILLEGIPVLTQSVDNNTKNEISRYQRFLEQSLFDPSLHQSKLTDLERQLREHIVKAERKIDLAHLYSKLLIEWIQQPDSAADNDDTTSEQSYEVVQDRQKQKLNHLRDRFAKVVFEPLNTDEVDIDNYLLALFGGEADHSTLRNIRQSVSDSCKAFLDQSFELTTQTLEWCIKALVKDSLFNEQKKAILEDFLKDPAVLSEICDVLNMRYRDLANWDWNVGEEGLPVVPRRALNGTWRVMVDEDLLQALFTHWIGTTWAVEMKGILKHTARDTSLWKSERKDMQAHKARRKYFLGHSLDFKEVPSVATERRRVYDNTFFMSPLPTTMSQPAAGYDDDGERDHLSVEDIKQTLLRTLATETLLHRTINGEVAVVQSDFQWFATGLSHSTVFAVMRFVGFTETWISWFKKFLEPPLNMLDGKPVRARKRGLPMSHIIEKLLGELILYFMDLAVAQNDGMMLYRFHDDSYVVGSPKECADSWDTMNTFARVMGLELNKSKTGSVYFVENENEKDQQVLNRLPTGKVAVNFLQLDGQTCSWVIDQDTVKQHVEQLQKQLLGKGESILQRVKTWNSCIGRFFGLTLGQPAHCLGRKHLDSILRTHQNVQRFLFGNDDRSMQGYIQRLIQEQFKVEDIPASFIAMPEKLGGLEVNNPFVPLLLLRENICDDPLKKLQDCLAKERKRYAAAKAQFDNMTEREQFSRYESVFGKASNNLLKDVSLTWRDARSFMTYEEYTQHREYFSGQLLSTYKYLMSEPEEDVIPPTQRISQSLKKSSYLETSQDSTGRQARKQANGAKTKIFQHLYKTPSVQDIGDTSVSWTLQSFEDELFDKYGGVEVADKRLLPLGVMQAMRAKKLVWNMVL